MQNNELKIAERMRNFVIIAALMAAFVCSTTCAQNYKHQYSSGVSTKHVKASKTMANKEYHVADFSSIALSGGMDMEYAQCPGKPRVEVYTSDNLLDLIDIGVEGGKLKIGFKRGYKISYNVLKVKVQSAEIEAIALSGSGDIRLADGVKSDKLKLSVSGSGDIDFSHLTCSSLKVSVAGSGDIDGKGLTCDALDIAISGSGDMKFSSLTVGSVEASIAGSGDIELQGSGEKAIYRISGSGEIKAKELQVKRAECHIAGSGDIQCHATDFLKVRTAGAGSVGYKGNPVLEIPKKGLYQLK